MKFKTSALAMTATVAVGLMSSAFAAETSYDKLGFSTNQTYSADASGPSNGSWNSTPVVTDSKIEIDSDADEPLTFTPATVNSGENTVVNATELKFNVEASVVPNSVGLATNDDAQCGFAIKDTSGVTNIWVFNGIEWKEASDATIPAAGEMFNLEVKLDYRSNPGKVQYLVEGTALKVASSTWLALPENKTSVSGIDFIGNGKLTSLNGYVLQIESEVIPIKPTGSGDVEVKFSEQQLNALRNALGTTDAVIEKLNSTKAQDNGQKPFDNYIMYGKIKDDDISASTVPVVKANPAEPPAGNENNVVVTVPTLNIQVVAGVTVTHKLMGSATGADGSWTQVGDAKTGANPQFEIPHDSTNRYFKVETAVSTTGVAK